MLTEKNTPTSNGAAAFPSRPSVAIDLESDPVTSPSPTALAASGCRLRWVRLRRTVEITESNAGLLRSSIAKPTPADVAAVRGGGAGVTTRVILNNISGEAAPGEVLAMMGPSGSGKTSLLDSLSGRSRLDAGSLFINDAPADEHTLKRLRRKMAYVKQTDIFFTHLTVLDQLTYTALLRLPGSMATADKHVEVQRILSLLRLHSCANTMIMSVSGGERKRTNIGTELLTNPFIILLDEPTSGLDSTSAMALTRTLRDLAETGKTIITSIHQPSSGVFANFDRVMFLSGGNAVYHGTPGNSLKYLEDRGMPCPVGYNAADHWMDLLVADELDGDESKANILIAAWDGERIADALLNSVKHGDGWDATPVEKWSITWFAQFRVLFHRSLKNSRSSIFTTLNLIKSVLIGALVGCIWFQLEYTERAVTDRSSYYFFTMTYWVFDAMFAALLCFPAERDVIFKERASGSYQLSAYFLAKTLSEAPTRLSLPTIYMTISYWMAGLNPEFSVFLLSCLCSLLSVLAGESLGLLVGATVMDMEQAMVILTVCTLTLMLVGGFFVKNIPFWIKWIRFLSPFKYAFDASQNLTFNRNVPCDGSGVLLACNIPGATHATPEQIREELVIEGSVIFNAMMLIVIFLVARLGAFFSLKSHRGGERS